VESKPILSLFRDVLGVKIEHGLFFGLILRAYEGVTQICFCRKRGCVMEDVPVAVLIASLSMLHRFSDSVAGGSVCVLNAELSFIVWIAYGLLECNTGCHGISLVISIPLSCSISSQEGLQYVKVINPPLSFNGRHYSVTHKDCVPLWPSRSVRCLVLTKSMSSW
jgi:hypothetical protein